MIQLTGVYDLPMCRNYWYSKKYQKKSENIIYPTVDEIDTHEMAIYTQKK